MSTPRATVGQVSAGLAVSLAHGQEFRAMVRPDAETGISEKIPADGAVWSTDGFGKPGRIGHVYLTLANGQEFALTVTEMVSA